MPNTSTGAMLDFSKALETNITLVELDLRENCLSNVVIERLTRTMKEKRSVVPYPMDTKICFLLCNRHLPHHLQLPEVNRVAEFSNLFTFGVHSPLFLIFQYCAQARQLYLDTGDSNRADLERMRERMRRHFFDTYQVPEHEVALNNFLDRHF